MSYQPINMDGWVELSLIRIEHTPLRYCFRAMYWCFTVWVLLSRWWNHWSGWSHERR